MTLNNEVSSQMSNPLSDPSPILWALKRLQEFGALSSSEEAKQMRGRLVAIADAMADPKRPDGVKGLGDAQQ